MRPSPSLTAALAATLAIGAAAPIGSAADDTVTRARPTVVRVSDPDGFDWADAGIGAAGGVALSMLGVGLALGGIRTKG
jgi:hypothetical protein